MCGLQKRKTKVNVTGFYDNIQAKMMKLNKDKNYS